MLVTAELVRPILRIYSGDTSWLFPVAIIALIIFGVLWFMSRARDARDRQARQQATAQGHDVGAFQQDHVAHSTAAVAATPFSATDDRGAAWSELFASETSASRLAEIAARYPEYASQIAAHPNCYPELARWAAGAIHQQGGAA